MSGHSKWASIKHKKGAADAKRGKLFTKIIKEITTAAKLGGGDPTGNPRLRKALDDAKAANMPAENMERAVKKGTGELEGVMYEEVDYGGTGPSGVMILVQTMTDNRNRTVSELRKIFSKHNGTLGETASVDWMFNKVGLIEVKSGDVSEDELMEAGMDAGIEDIRGAGEFWEVVTSTSALYAVKEALEGADIKVARAEVVRIPQSTVKLEGRNAEVFLRMCDIIEDHEDVQKVWDNSEIDDSVLQQLSS
ncbi:MAG: YebC/PmpR family DNA-binding transcriptional regulator [Deltaproteobacteria bacterium]|nr:YebC/PmpR family DNA-binding transcriptional regulator [Deltaproteobacteria bacterium]